VTENTMPAAALGALALLLTGHTKKAAERLAGLHQGELILIARAGAQLAQIALLLAVRMGGRNGKEVQ